MQLRSPLVCKLFFFLMIRPPPRSTLLPYTTLLRSSRRIRGNAGAPGVIGTGMSNFTKTESGLNPAPGMQALKRIGQPCDVADVIVFLCSEDARWITGASIPVDGGSKL